MYLMLATVRDCIVDSWVLVVVKDQYAMIFKPFSLYGPISIRIDTYTQDLGTEERKGEVNSYVGLIKSIYRSSEWAFRCNLGLSSLPRDNDPSDIL